MSIPKNTTNVASPASKDAELLATLDQRERENNLHSQQMMANSQMQGLEIFAFIISLFTGMKSGTGVGAPEALKGFARAFNIDTSKFTDTINNYHSGKISAYEAANRTYKSTDASSVDMAAAEKVVAKYAESGNPLLELIADKESGADYNRVYGAGIQRTNLTGMTVDEVLQWQRNYVNSGSPSSAAGKYQIIQKTLHGLKDEMGLSGKELFDEKMQDRMAEHLLDRRGYQEYLSGHLSEEKFMRNISKEWASMPKDASGQSYYAGDGLNKAHATPATLLLAIRHTKETPVNQRDGVKEEYNGKSVASAKSDDAIEQNKKDAGVDVAQKGQETKPSPDEPKIASTEAAVSAAV